MQINISISILIIFNLFIGCSSSSNLLKKRSRVDELVFSDTTRISTHEYSYKLFQNVETNLYYINFLKDNRVFYKKSIVNMEESRKCTSNNGCKVHAFGFKDGKKPYLRYSFKVLGELVVRNKQGHVIKKAKQQKSIVTHECVFAEFPQETREKCVFINMNHIDE